MHLLAGPAIRAALTRLLAGPAVRAALIRLLAGPAVRAALIRLCLMHLLAGPALRAALLYHFPQYCYSEAVCRRTPRPHLPAPMACLTLCTTEKVWEDDK